MSIYLSLDCLVRVKRSEDLPRNKSVELLLRLTKRRSFVLVVGVECFFVEWIRS